MAGGDSFGIDVPHGDPAALEAAAGDLRAAAGVMGGVGASLGGAASIPGWTGEASFQYASRCVSHRDVLASADLAMDAAARIFPSSPMR